MKMQISKYLLPLFIVWVITSCNKEGGPNGGGQTETPKDWTISGYVKGNDGKALEGVVVSDGLNCVKTDKEGRYYLLRYEKGFLRAWGAIKVKE